MLALAGNGVRLKMLFLLLDQQQLCVCDLADVLQMNVSAISQHLRKLKDGGVVQARKVGQTVFYTLTPALRPVVAAAAGVRFHLPHACRRMNQPASTPTKSLAGTGLLAALAASLCCITPLLAIVGGLGGVASTFSWLEPLRPYLVALTVGVLGFAWYQQLRPGPRQPMTAAAPCQSSPP